MADFTKNKRVYSKQMKVMVAVIVAISLILTLVIALLAQGKPSVKENKEAVDLVGIINESFTEKNTESAMTEQQVELESLKEQISNMTKKFDSISEAKSKENSLLQDKLKALSEQVDHLKEAKKETAPLNPELKNPTLWHQENPQPGYHPAVFQNPARNGMKLVSFDGYYKSKSTRTRRYVPSNTSVRAVLLGGADADASVNGQSNNNGVMLFKFLDDGTMPNGAKSYLRGCRVSASSYGDISSERAYATLYKLSCAKKGEPIIDKAVTGWVFFGGKVGIKGVPLMRDGKVVTWAGISGGLSGVAQAAQAAQSIQNITPIGATSILPSDRVAGFAGFGGASKAAEQLSSYYIKRAEQYHPVIQVGAGNVATIVFKDGFYLESEEDRQESVEKESNPVSHDYYSAAQNKNSEQFDVENYSVPPEVLSHINKVQQHRAKRQEG